MFSNFNLDHNSNKPETILENSNVSEDSGFSIDSNTLKNTILNIKPGIRSSSSLPLESTSSNILPSVTIEQVEDSNTELKIKGKNKEISGTLRKVKSALIEKLSIFKNKEKHYV